MRLYAVLCVLLGHRYRDAYVPDLGGWWLVDQCTRCGHESIGVLLRGEP